MTVKRASALCVLILVDVFLVTACILEHFNPVLPYRRAAVVAFREYMADRGNPNKRDAWIEQRGQTERVRLTVEVLLGFVALISISATLLIWRHERRGLEWGKGPAKRPRGRPN